MGKRVLIVDDDRVVRTMVATTLDSLGVEDIVEASSGDECLDILGEQDVDVVVLDWHMPGTKGIDVLRIVRSGGSTIPILMVTGESTEDRVIEAIQAGASDYLVKPFDHAVLREKLDSLCGDPRSIHDPVVYRARSVMSQGVISITSDVTVGEAIELLLEHSISGLPVVDNENMLIGIITEFRLIRAISEPELKTVPVRDLMTTDVLSVAEDTVLSEVATLMEKNRVRLVPVARNSELVGVVARRDLLRYIIHNEEAAREFLAAAAEDSESLGKPTPVLS